MSWGLPTSLEINGIEHPIRYQFTAILDIFKALNDPELEDKEKVYCLLYIFYEDFEDMDVSDYEEALKKAIDFIDNGQPRKKKDSVKLVDFEQDEKLLIPAINRVAGKEIRLEKDIHWWTFLGWFMEIGECTYSQVLNIRAKKSQGKQLESWEQEFYTSNKDICDIHVKLSEEDLEEERKLNELLS